MITPKPGIMDIALYQGGKGHLDGIENIVKLSSNENPYGASPAAQDAFVKEAGHLAVYPSSDQTELRDAIAAVHGLDPARIILGNGSDELISYICQAFAGEGDEVMFTEHGFAMYRIRALASSATPVEVPEDNRRTDVDALIERASEATKICFVANPNNPTGTMIPVEELRRLAQGLPETCLLVIDAAYAEYVADYDGGAALTDDFPNVIMTRTFSKIYGLGGLRLGWGYGPQELIDILSRLRDPFNVNSGALAAGLAAVQDRDFVETCRTENTKWRGWLAAELDRIGIPSDPSEGNFLLARFTDEAEAEAANTALQNSGIIVRQVSSYGLPHCLRMTIGRGDDCRRIVSVLTRFKEVQS